MLIRRSATHAIAETAQGAASAGQCDIDLAQAARFELGSLKLEPATLQLRFRGETRTIEPRVMQVLMLLASERGRVVSRDRLVDRCWGGRAVSEDAINRCIAKVRRLGTEFKAYDIETIPRVGYRLVERGAAAAAGAEHWELWRVAALVAAALVLALAAWGLSSRWPHRHASSLIALASFTPLNSGADARLYADSMRDSASDTLQDTGAQLVSPDLPIATLDDARRAGAGLMITATVRHDGPTIRITAVAQSTLDGSTVFSNVFEAPVADAAALSDNVAATLAKAMRLWIALSKIEPDQSTTDAIVRSLTVLDGRDSVRTIELLRALAQAKPNSAAAQAIFAYKTAQFLEDVPADQRSAVVSDARQAALRAAALRPEFQELLPCGLKPPGVAVLTPECDRALRRAVAADPDSPYAFYHFAQLLGQSGRLREAEGLARSALAQSPFDDGRLSVEMFMLEMQNPPETGGQFADLDARVRRYWPYFLIDEYRYIAAISNGDFAGAERMLNPPSGDVVLSGRGKDIAVGVLHAVQSRSPADIAAARAQCLPSAASWTPPPLAFETCETGLAALNDLDAVFALESRGYRDVECCGAQAQERFWLQSGGFYYMRYQLWGSVMAPVRADSRFIDVSRRTGLLAYWKSGHPPDFCAFERAPVCELLRS